jgi:putative aminopeptidase FrvX
MDGTRRAFLDELLTTPSPAGFEAEGQRVWVNYVSEFADEVRTDNYGNAVATLHGDGPELAFVGHADEIGYMVRRIDDDGFVHLERVGGTDPTVTQGQHVVVHAADGPVNGVVGQSAIHLRDGDDEVPDVSEMRVDVGAEDGEAARELLEVGDPITPASGVRDLAGTTIAARGVDNRAGTWVAAEALRRAAEAGADATVHAVSTVQEELGKQGAKMVSFDLDPDAAVAVDVTHATDYTAAAGDSSTGRGGDVELGAGPVVHRGSSNHPEVVDAVRAAAGEDVPVQLQAAGRSTGTDADAFYTARGGIPSLNLGLPNRYMHTPVEVVDTVDLEASADLLAAFAERAAGRDGFSVDV